MPRTRLRKQQTRLGFTPLPSSSPAAKGYNQQIRDRAAAVVIEDGSPSPAKRRTTRPIASETITLDDDNEIPAMPTPAASRERAAIHDSDSDLVIVDDSDDLPIRPTPRRSNKPRSRQQGLDFSSTRDPASFDSPVRLPSSTIRTRFSTKTTMFSSQVQPQIADFSSDDSDAGGLPSPAELLKSKKAKKSTSKEKRRTTRSTQNTAIDEDSGSGVDNREHAPSEDAAVEDDDGMPVGTQRRRQMRSARSSSPTQITDSEEDDVPTTQRRRLRQASKSSPVETETEDEDGVPTTQGKQRRGGRRQRRSSFINDSPPPMDDSDDDVEIVERPSRKRRRQLTESESGSEGNEDDDEPRRRPKKARQLSDRELAELQEDIEDLGGSSDTDSPQRSMPRSSQSIKKTASQKALEKLKRNRSSQLPRVDEDEHEDGGEDGNIDEDEQDGGDEDDDEVEMTSSRNVFQRHADDEGFIEEDEEDTLGVPEGIPIEFTRYATQKPKELFKHAVEWMVCLKINPAFNRDDALYRLTFKKLDDEASGLASSKFSSSAWTEDFTASLKGRPDVAYEPIDREAPEHALRDRCDACNRSGHPATFMMQFQDKPYDRDTLEEVDEDSSSESEGNGSGNANGAANLDEPDYDTEGRRVPPVNTIYYVGRHCKENAVTAHNLQHWLFHLNLYVQNYLSRQGYYGAEELAKRNDWHTKKRQKYACRIVDRMEGEGEVKHLWRMFRNNIDSARQSKQGRFVSGGL